MKEYKTLAYYYDFLLSPFLFTMRSAVTREAIELKPEKVVDLCCGTGKQLKLLKKSGIVNLTGVDISEEMLLIARKGSYAPLCLMKSAFDTGLESGSIDLVNINLALHEKSRGDALLVIHEALRLLKPGAVLLIADYNPSLKLPRPAAVIIKFIEFLAGGDHYLHFKEYMKNGGLQADIAESGFTLEKKNLVALEGISVETWSKNKL